MQPPSLWPKSKNKLLASFGFLLCAFCWLLRIIFNPALKVDRVDITVDSLKHSSVSELKIILLTDFHYDQAYWPALISDDTLDSVVRLTNAEDADLVLLTGDYVDRASKPISNLTAKWLSKLKAKYGVYAVTGNHDYKDGQDGSDFIKQTLVDGGITVLTSESCRPINFDPLIELVGLGDINSHGTKDFDILRAFSNTSTDPRVTRIVMSHNPDTAKFFTPWKVDLQVSGHTHGGQICWPWNGKPVLGTIHYFVTNWIPFLKNKVPRQTFAVRRWDWAVGLSQVPAERGSNRIYTSRGLGTHLPCRVACPLEISVIRLVSGEDK